MSGKYMKVKKVVIPMLTLIVLTSQLMGCASVTKEQASDMISSTSVVEVEVSEPDNSTTESGSNGGEVISKVEPLEWWTLSGLGKYPTIRKATNTALNIQSGKGSIYIDLEGHQQLNNTLLNALRNKEFGETQLNDSAITNQIMAAVNETFTDLEESDEKAAFFNSYWYLLPDEAGEVAEFKGSQTLTRAQAMTLVMRAITPVEDGRKPKTDSAFTAAVGDTVYTDYASYVNSKAYLNTTDNTLNEGYFNGKMSRAEYIYLCLNSVFSADELNSIDITKVNLIDCIKGTGNDLVAAVENPDNGVPESLYNAIARANVLGIVNNETRWDEPIAKTEAVDMFAATVQAYNGKYGYVVDLETAQANEALKEKAKASYAKLKDQLTIDEDTYVNEYVKMAEQGVSEEGIEADLLARYGKEALKPVEKPTEPTWIETAVSGTYYINTACNSRAKAIQGSDVVKQYKLNDTVTVIAKTDTGYYKLADGEFIHGDYLSDSKVTVQQSTQPSGGNNNGSSGNGELKHPFTGEKKTPSEGATKVSEEQTGVDKRGYEVIGYYIEAPGGKFFFDETTGGYYRSFEDCLNGKNPVGVGTVFPYDPSIGNGIHVG